MKGMSQKMKLTSDRNSVNTSSVRLKGMSQKTIMTVFWILFAIGALAVLFLIANFIFVRLVGVQIA